MSTFRKLRRGLDPKKLAVAAMLRRCQIIEPDPKRLIENFPEVFERAFAPQQKEVEVYEPKNPSQETG